MAFWTQNTGKKRNLIRWIIFMTIGVSAIPLVIFFFPHALNKQYLFDVRYFTVNNQPRVITVYQEKGSSEDGDYLSGYWLYLLDPTTNKELHKIFIKRSENDVPTNPETYFFAEKEIWLIGRPGFTSGDKNFQAIVEIKNDQFTIASNDFLNGWTIGAVSGNLISLSNQYNELGCLDVMTRKISVSGCPYDDPVYDTLPPVQTSFFFVKNTPTSTRSKLYCYHTSEVFPPPGIFSGSPPQDGTIPSWHLMDAVNMNYGSLDENTVKAYQAKFEKSETIVGVNEKQLFNSPRVIFSNDSICILTCLNDDGLTNSFHQYSSSGKLIWKTDCPKLKSSTSVYSTKGIYSKAETILIHPENWVIAINNADGTIKWKCPK
jgi:outer membrane protein assembly factor BamB